MCLLHASTYLNICILYDSFLFGEIIDKNIEPFVTRLVYTDRYPSHPEGSITVIKNVPQKEIKFKTKLTILASWHFY